MSIPILDDMGREYEQIGYGRPHHGDIFYCEVCGGVFRAGNLGHEIVIVDAPILAIKEAK
jgi:hypothetical protein